MNEKKIASYAIAFRFGRETANKFEASYDLDALRDTQENYNEEAFGSMSIIEGTAILSVLREKIEAQVIYYENLVAYSHYLNRNLKHRLIKYPPAAMVDLLLDAYRAVNERSSVIA